ncbi:MAG: (d)CMP kinase [Planctomycetota bacterium]
MIIAIDGPAGSGKSTAARALAARYGMGYLDTGAMYRCVTLAALRAGALAAAPERLAELAAAADIRFGPLEDGRQQVWLGEEDVTQAIREEALTESIRQVSQVPEVRRVLVRRQREMGIALLEQNGGCVIEGRDIGTTVFPDAYRKFWLQADLVVRAERRAQEAGGDESAARQTVMLHRRDEADHNPAAGSMVKAHDAITVDTTEMDPEAVVNHLAAGAGLPVV